MSNTVNQIRLDGILGPVFDSTIGVPQGDTLSPALFIIYLEAVLQDLAVVLKDRFGIDFPTCIIYADDIDFVLQFPLLVDQIHTIAPKVFAKWGLKMNCEKTEITFITHDWKNTCKLGSLLDINRDIQRRKTLAQRLSNSCWKLWDKKLKLTLKTKDMLYNSLIRPILLYNCGTSGLTKQQLDALESSSNVGIYFTRFY